MTTAETSVAALDGERRPVWDTRQPLSARDRESWEAAYRTAMGAPEIRRGDDIADELRRALAGLPQELRAIRAAARQDAA